MNVIEELELNKVTNLPVDDVKANPSVNSPNEGGFNSEENLKWAVNKLTTKNFIIGKNVEEVNDQLNPKIYSDKIGFGDGMFNIEGYTFKISEPGQTSFDKNINKYADNFYMGTNGPIDFVTNLVSAQPSISTKLLPNFEDFCFSKFIPTSTDYDESVWTNAANKKSSLLDRTVGYARLTYLGEYLDQLEAHGDYITLSGKDNRIRIINNDLQSVEDIKSIIEVDGKVVPDYILEQGTKVNPDVSGIVIGEPFALATPVDQPSFLNIEDIVILDIYYPVFVKKTVASTKDKVQMIIYFDDIFELEFTHNQSYDKYKTVPNESFGTVRTANSNFFSPNQGESTVPFYIYNDLYNSSLNRESIYTLPLSTGNTLFNTDTLNAFKLITIRADQVNDLLTSMQKEISGTYDLSYYCFDLNETGMAQYKPTGYNNVQTYVAFMDSNGELCPEGFKFTNSDGIVETDNMVLEGYVHFLRRVYAIQHSVSIDTVTIDTLCESNWLSVNNTIADLYYFKPMSYYLNACYSVCLNTLINNSDIDKSVTNVKYFISNADNCMNYCTHRNPSGTTTGSLAILCDDPYNVLFKSSGNGLSNYKIPFTLYKYYGGELTRFDTVTNVEVSETLTPICPSNPKQSKVSNNDLNLYFVTEDSDLVNSLRFTYGINTWFCNIPTVITVKKDGHNYLIGRETNGSEVVYGGVEICNKIPKYIIDNDLYIYNLNVSSESYNIDNTETKFVYISMSQPVYVQRNAFLHVSKIYGDNNQSFEELVQNMIFEATYDIDERIKQLWITVYGTDTDPGLEDIVLGNEDLQINGNVNDIEDLEARVVIIEDAMLNLLLDFGIIGEDVSYKIKKFGLVNITPDGINKQTFDFGTTDRDVSPLGSNDMVKYVFIKNKAENGTVKKLGNKLFYHTPNLTSINTGEVVKVNRLLVKDTIIMTNGKLNLFRLQSIPENVIIYPGTVRVNVPVDDGYKMYRDNTEGGIYNRFDTSKTIVGSVDYCTGEVVLNEYINGMSYNTRCEFRYCELVTKYGTVFNELPSTVLVLGDQVFTQDVDRGFKDKGIRNIKLNNNLMSIGYACFWGTALESIEIPASVGVVDQAHHPEISPTIGTYTFAHCENLKRVDYRGSYIADHAFNWCSGLGTGTGANDKFTIYSTCGSKDGSYIGSKVFTYSPNLTTIYYEGSVSDWYQINKKTDWASKESNTFTNIPYSGIQSVICSDGEFSNTYVDFAGEKYYVYNYNKTSDTTYPNNEFQLTTYNNVTVQQGSSAFVIDRINNNSIVTIDIDISNYSEDFSIAYDDRQGFVVGESYSPQTELPLQYKLYQSSGTLDRQNTRSVGIYSATNLDSSDTTPITSIVEINPSNGIIQIKMANKSVRVHFAWMVDGLIIWQAYYDLTTSDPE